MRKLVYGALALSAALAVGFGTGAKDAKAADAPVIQTNGDDTLKITATGASKILVGVPSFKSNVKSGTSTDKTKQTIAVSTWDVYDGTTAEVDLSKYAKTKDAYLMIKTDFQNDSEAVAVKIPASLGLSATYDKKTGAITITQSDRAKTKLTGDNLNLNYYTDSHSEGTITVDAEGVATGGFLTNDLKKFQMSGASLYIETQLKAMTTAAGVNGYSQATQAEIVIGTGTSQKAIVDGTDAASAQPVKAYVFAARSSKPVKLNITKLANAPKVTPNYAKGTITIPKAATAKFVSVNSEYNAGSDTSFVTTDKVGMLNLGKENTAWTKAEDGTSSATIDARGKFAIDIYTTAVTTGDKKSLASRAGRYIFDAQEETILNTLSYTVSYASGKYTGLVESTDTVNKYTVYYTDASTNHVAKTATTTLQTGTGDNVKKGSAKLVNIDTTKNIYVTRDGIAKTLTWIGTKVDCDAWETINQDDSQIVKYDVAVTKKTADKDDTDVDAAYKAVEAALTTAKKTYKKDDKVEITVAEADKAKLDAVLITADNAVNTDSDKLTVSDGKIKFTVKADKKTTITIAKKSFGVTVQALEADKDAEYVKSAVTAITSKVNGKTYKKGDTVKDVEKAFDSKKVVVTCSGGIAVDGSVYKLTSAAAGVLTVAWKKYAVTVPASTNIVFSDDKMTTAVSDLSDVGSGTVLYIKEEEGKNVTVSGVTPTAVTGGYKITVDGNVNVTVEDATTP